MGKHRLTDIMARTAIVLLWAVLLTAVGGAVWSCQDRTGWVRFVTGSVPAGWLRAALLGWF